jgi:hypothetical protein
VRLIGRAGVDIVLDALDRGAGNLGLRRRFDLRGRFAGQQLLDLAVGLVAAERRIALPRRGLTALRWAGGALGEVQLEGADGARDRPRAVLPFVLARRTCGGYLILDPYMERIRPGLCP